MSKLCVRRGTDAIGELLELRHTERPSFPRLRSWNGKPVLDGAVRRLPHLARFEGQIVQENQQHCVAVGTPFDRAEPPLTSGGSGPNWLVLKVRSWAFAAEPLAMPAPSVATWWKPDLNTVASGADR